MTKFQGWIIIWALLAIAIVWPAICSGINASIDVDTTQPNGIWFSEFLLEFVLILAAVCIAITQGDRY